MTAPRRPILLSWSGGKDAAWALHALRARDDVEVVGFVTTLTEGYDRIAMQGVRREILHAQAESCGVPVVEAWMPQRSSNTVYEDSYAAALAEAQRRWPGLRDIAFGDLFLADIRAYREALCARLGWMPHFPIFDPSPGYTARMARAMRDAGLRAALTCVDSTQLDAHFAGREFDENLLADLPSSVDPCGENGEFHTVAYAGPMFATPLALRRGETVLRDERFVYTDFALASW
ncbi:MAG: ATP-binding protein [Xanthomonadaceae bacterium]|nr:ATP-binding protein [Xanthomonadaceae bacterium]